MNDIESKIKKCFSDICSNTDVWDNIRNTGIYAKPQQKKAHYSWRKITVAAACAFICLAVATPLFFINNNKIVIPDASFTDSESENSTAAERSETDSSDTSVAEISDCESSVECSGNESSVGETSDDISRVPDDTSEEISEPEETSTDENSSQEESETSQSV